MPTRSRHDKKRSDGRVPASRRMLAFCVLVLFGFLAGAALRHEQGTPDPAVSSLPADPSAPGGLLKIGFTSDWEYGYRHNMGLKETAQAPELLSGVIDHFNSEFRPDIIIAGGDYIEGTGLKAAVAAQQLREIVGLFRRVQAPVLFALGNHDLRSLDKAAAEEILGIPSGHAYEDIGDWRVVVLDTNFNQKTGADRGRENYVYGYVPPSELSWLDQALATDRPTLVFSHHSLYDTVSDQPGKLQFNILNGPEVRAVLERHPSVVANIAGHTAKAQMAEHNGIYYYVANTLVERDGLGAFADIELRYNPLTSRTEITFRHFGQDAQFFRSVSWIRK